MDIFGVTNANNRAAINLAAFKVLANLGIKMKNIPVKLNNIRANRNRASCAQIPHLETVPTYGRQIVIGRQSTLKNNNYYKCDRFIASNVMGKQGFNWTTTINDLFIYYASTMVRQAFPIRLIDRPVAGNNTTAIRPNTVTHREIEQIKKFFKMYMYRSLTHPGVFFFSSKPNMKYKNIVRV